MTSSPIKVLHFICSTGFYGAEKWILALANNSDRNLVTSELVVTKESDDHELQLVTDFNALGLTSHQVEMKGRFDLRAIRSLVKLIKANDIDILHSHGYKSDILGLMAAKMAGIKCISTPHGFEKTNDWKLEMFIAAGCRTFKYFDLVVPLSRELYADVERYKVPDEKIVYIRNGVDLKDVDYRLPAEDPVTRSDNDAIQLPETKTIGFIGQMIDRKNVTHLLDVFENLAASNNGLKLVLLGDGISREKYEQYANNLQSRDRISFLGFQTDPITYLQSFDLFVMCSTLEGIPRCLMEAMAVGVPVAAYDIPGVNQLLDHNKTGMLATLGNKQELETCCKSLLWDENLANRISKAAASHINEKFSAKRMAAEYTEHYYQLMDREQTLPTTAAASE